MISYLVLALASQVSSAPAPEVRLIAASKVILVGDSTTAVVSGWGPSFCASHVTSLLACVNLARGGRSSASYRAEGSWKVALGEMRVAGYRRTWVLIQFGHNDQPGKPGRSTDLATEFPANLARYIDEARAAGAVPVLVTPLTRRSFRGGVLVDDLAPWADAVRRIAAEKRVPLVDFHALSRAAVAKMGETAADGLAQRPPGTPAAGEAPPCATTACERPMASSKLSFDHTHLGRDGADYFARMLTAELDKAVPDMRPMLIP